MTVSFPFYALQASQILGITEKGMVNETEHQQAVALRTLHGETCVQFWYPSTPSQKENNSTN